MCYLRLDRVDELVELDLRAAVAVGFADHRIQGCIGDVHLELVDEGSQLACGHCTAVITIQPIKDATDRPAERGVIDLIARSVAHSDRHRCRRSQAPDAET